LIIILKMPEMV